MMNGQLLIAMVFVTALSQPDTVGPILVGDHADELSVADSNDIANLIGAEGPAWMLDVDTLGPPTKPPNLIVTAYLVPYLKTESIRRGRAIWLHQEASEAREIGYEWHRSKRPTEWAQVAMPGHKFTTKLTKPGEIDRLIVVKGKITDIDLLEVVQYIRSGPLVSRSNEEDDGADGFEGGPEVESKYPVIGVIAKGDCYFEINTQQRPGAGQSIQVIRSGGGWQVIGVSEWVV